MTKEEAFIYANDCNVLSFVPRLKLKAVRHLKSNFNLLADARKQYNEIPNLKEGASEEEIKKEQEDFLKEEFEGGFFALPVEWFDELENKPFSLTMNDSKEYSFMPSALVESLIKGKVIKTEEGDGEI